METSIVRPRINDFYNILLRQDDVEFAIPFINEDIPLYVDPFLLWKSPHMMDNSLHTSILQSFNHLGWLMNKGNTLEAKNILVQASECDAVGLRTSRTRQGKRIGEKLAMETLSLFTKIPDLQSHGFSHIEEIQLLIDGISKDRVSDIVCSLMSAHLVDFTTQQCELYRIPLQKISIENLYDSRVHRFVTKEVSLPVNPETNMPIWFVPKRWLRFSPYINPDEYFKVFFPATVDTGKHFKDRYSIINYNVTNYGCVRQYTDIKERAQQDCTSDPLFKQIPITSAKRTMAAIKKLPIGKTDNADKKYETEVCKLLSSLLYPHLDFAQEQSRILSGSIIRDLVFYNNVSIEFFRYLYEIYKSRQVVFELKNVQKLDRDHVNQINGYLNDAMGHFGIIITRNPVPKNIKQRLVDLWSGQRRCILVLTDADLEMMVNIYDNKQRLPYEVIVKKYHEFKLTCPS